MQDMVTTAGPTTSIAAELEAFINACAKNVAILDKGIAARLGDTSAQHHPQHRMHLQATVSIIYERLSSLKRRLEDSQHTTIEKDDIPAIISKEGGTAPPPRWETVVGCDLGEDFSFSEGETQELESESKRLLAELSARNEEAHQFEEKLLEVAMLSHTFATKVAEQSEEVELLSADAAVSSANMVAGNAQLRSADDNLSKSGICHAVVIFVAALMLLMLDWWFS